MSTTQSRIEIIDGSEENLTIHKKINGVISDIQIRAFELNVHSPNVKLSRLEIILVYNSKSGLLGWRCLEIINSIGNERHWNTSQIDLFLEQRYIHLSKTKMVFFILSWPPNIWVREFFERYSTFEEAYQTFFNTLEEKLEEIERGEAFKRLKEIPIGKYVKIKFFYKDKYAFFHGESVAKISEVRYQYSTWKLVLESYEKRQTTLILDEGYQVIDVFGDGAISMNKSK